MLLFVNAPQVMNAIPKPVARLPHSEVQQVFIKCRMSEQMNKAYDIILIKSLKLRVCVVNHFLLLYKCIPWKA